MKKLIIHCSDSPNGRNDRAKDLHRWHLERGWSGIGYHYVICIDGAIEAGRPEYWEGAHCSGHNANSLGICMIGTDEFSKEQWQALEHVVKGILARYPDIKIHGHNEFSSKQCPGFDVKQWAASHIPKP